LIRFSRVHPHYGIFLPPALAVRHQLNNFIQLPWQLAHYWRNLIDVSGLASLPTMTPL